MSQTTVLAMLPMAIGLGSGEQLQRPHPSTTGAHSPDSQGQRHIVQRVQLVKQVMVLEDETDQTVAEVGPFLAVEPPDLVTIESK